MDLVEREGELAAIDAVLRRGGVLLVEGGAGRGKTSLLDEAARRALASGREVFRAGCSELEAGFAFGVVRQLFEGWLASAGDELRDDVLAGVTDAARGLLDGRGGEATAVDATFAVLHGLYWLVADLADRRPVVILVDDAQWADAPSLRWLAHLAPRLEGLAVAVVVASRPLEPVAEGRSMRQLRASATIVRPGSLSRDSVTAIARRALGTAASDELCSSLHVTTGGNPFYVTELLRGADAGHGSVRLGGEGITRHVVARLDRLEPAAMQLGQALAVLRDGCRLRDGAVVAGLTMPTARRAADDLVRAEVLADADPSRFVHPIVRDAIDGTLSSGQRAAAHSAAARLYFREGAPAQQVAAHLMSCRPAGDPWVVARLRAAAGEAMSAATPEVAAALLQRALAEPPPAALRVALLRDLARAEATAGHQASFTVFEEALALTDDPGARAEIVLELAEAYASLFRWVDAVDVIDRGLGELDGLRGEIFDRLQGVLVVSGLHDARRAAAVRPALARVVARGGVSAGGLAAGMGMVLAGRPARETAAALREALDGATSAPANWDARAALLWCLVTAECYDDVEGALGPFRAEVERSGSARGYVAVYSALGFLKLRLGALPDADAAGRIALRVLREGDFDAGLAFGATVLADVAIEAGDLDEAGALLALLPQELPPPGVGTVLIPATRGRLHLARGHWPQALHEFKTCAAMFSADTWGMELRDTGYLHARSGAAQALLALDRRDDAEHLAEAELADVRAFGAPRAIGVAARTAGLVAGGERGLGLLAESVAALRGSPARLERARSLLELGAALRRAGRRRDARDLLAEALDLAARCGAWPLTERARQELIASGARPRRAWRRGVEALTPSELRVARLAAEGATNRDIARVLYVSIKTVEGHLAQVYAKLGISGRGQLAAVLSPKDQGRDYPVAKASP